MLYALQSARGGPCKLGWTRDVLKRKAQLERRYGEELVLIACWPGGKAEETQLHRRFAHCRIGRSEQFRITAELQSFLVRPVQAGELSEVEALPDRVSLTLRRWG